MKIEIQNIQMLAAIHHINTNGQFIGTTGHHFKQLCTSYLIGCIKNKQLTRNVQVDQGSYKAEPDQ